MKLEWTAAVLGMVGAALLALKVNPGLGFGAFLASNAAWIAFALRRKLRGLLAQQLVFTVTSMVGIWNWWLAPFLKG